MLDLNALSTPTSGLVLSDAFNINERGEILGAAEPPGCTNTDACGRLFLLVPCVGDQADAKGCEEGAVAVSAGEAIVSGAPTMRRTTGEIGGGVSRFRRPGGPAGRRR